MYIVFFSTSNVFKAEALLNNAGISSEVVPTPASDRAYCGVCLLVSESTSLATIEGMEFEIIMEG